MRSGVINWIYYLQFKESLACLYKALYYTYIVLTKKWMIRYKKLLVQHTCYLCQYMVTWSTFLSFSKVNQEFRGWEKSVHLFAREWIGFIWILTLSVTRICGTCPPLGMGSLSPSMDWPVYNGNLRQVDSRSAGIQQYGQVCLSQSGSQGPVTNCSRCPMTFSVLFCCFYDMESEWMRVQMLHVLQVLFTLNEY